MPRRLEADEDRLDPEAIRCLERTRTRVFNVLILIGLSIMVSGLILGRLGWRIIVADVEGWRRLLYGGLIGVVAASHLTRRVMGSRERLREPETRGERFLRTRFVSALIAWLAAPLGLLYGLMIDPRLETVALFWAAALVLGILALPRAAEIEGFAEPMTPDEGRAE